MNLRGIVSVSGKAGLYKLIGQNKGGFILESLDAQKNKIVVSMTNHKMASLEDITIYGEESEIKLIDILENITKNTAQLPEAKAEGSVLRAYFRSVAEGHDEERVYASDMKKIINWYQIIKDLPLFTEEAPAPLDAPQIPNMEEQQAAQKVEAKASKSAAKPTKAAAGTTKALKTKKGA